MKRVIQILAVNLLVFIALLLFLELLVRVFYPGIPTPGTDRKLFKDKVYSDSKGLNPGTEGLSYGNIFRVNNSGFWNYSKKHSHGKKILIIGDSVTMGIGVEQDSSFAGILNNETIVDVLSPSSIGLSGQDYLNIISKICSDSTNNISSVFLFWCLNDVYNNYPDKDSPDIRSDNFITSLLDFFKQNFKLYYFLKDSFTDRPKTYYQYEEQFYESDNQLFNKAVTNLNNIADTLKDKNIQLKIFLLPYEYQLRTGRFIPQNLLLDSLSAKRLNVIDMRSAFKNEDSDKFYLYGDGIHFSELGHRQAAEFIKSKMNY